MRIIKTKHFAKWANKNKVSDHLLLNAAEEIANKLYEANYGGGVIKKRIANKGRGKSGSVRTIVAFRSGKNCFYVFGFEKSDKDNITGKEEKALKIVAKKLLSYSSIQIDGFIQDGSLIEVKNEQK